MTQIPFNRPSLVGREVSCIRDAIRRGQLAGDSHNTRNCNDIIREFTAVDCALLTHSCTGAFTARGWTSVILSLRFLSGLILAVLGVHGFHVGRLFAEGRNRPRILVERIADREPDRTADRELSEGMGR